MYKIIIENCDIDKAWNVDFYNILYESVNVSTQSINVLYTLCGWLNDFKIIPVMENEDINRFMDWLENEADTDWYKSDQSLVMAKRNSIRIAVEMCIGLRIYNEIEKDILYQ